MAGSWELGPEGPRQQSQDKLLPHQLPRSGSDPDISWVYGCFSPEGESASQMWLISRGSLQELPLRCSRPCGLSSFPPASPFSASEFP